MRYWLLLLLSTVSSALTAQTPLADKSSTACQASINGFKIKNVYIKGDHYNAVVWAYKHIAEDTCLTPVPNPAEADAILELNSLSSAPSSLIPTHSLCLAPRLPAGVFAATHPVTS